MPTPLIQMAKFINIIFLSVAQTVFTRTQKKNTDRVTSGQLQMTISSESLQNKPFLASD